ncbi:hypothetical protein B4N89_27315 [Embleya scabrispora]|uniref:Lipoprotein n=1 Tax=Embleya scabrispora TaxID=159449 RepID=A0A1T3P5A4_9ACTN|nr:hypothetical protein [Embleya scabrispora]OPC84141.1 hypothetical protein B4N89_27315 [Embleya scabrispora]
MKTPQPRTAHRVLAATLITGLALVLAGCGDKFTEPFKDAPRGATNNGPAEIITNPDGFSNVSAKCDGPNRVYVAYHGDETYAAIAVVPNDPRCVGLR